MNFERAVLTRIIDSGDLESAKRLNADHLFLPNCREGWAFILAHAEKHGAPPSRTLFVETYPQFEFDAFPDPVSALVEKVFDHYIYNQQQVFVEELARLAKVNPTDGLRYLVDQQNRFRSMLLSEDAPRYRSAAERVMELGSRPRLPTGFETLDANTRGGPRLGSRIVIGGAPSAGKTTLLVQLLWRYAQQGHLVMLLACDEEADDILIRVGQLSGLSRECAFRPS